MAKPPFFIRKNSMGEVTKKCFKCGKVKPISEFYKHSRMADGHLNKCKDCAKMDVAKRRTEHPEKDLDTRIKACKKNPTHKNANMAVDAAIRSGALTKPHECQGCGRLASETRLSAHHHDYARPLDVIWLCAACHRPIDHVRAFVESGKSWDEYVSIRHSEKAFINRAIKYYVEHVNVRSPKFDYESYVNDSCELD